VFSAAIVNPMQASRLSQGAAEFDQHVFEGRLGLVAVPRLVCAAGVDVGLVVAVPDLPDHDQGVDQHPEGDGPLDREAGAVTGLADARHVARVGIGLLARPPHGVPGDQADAGGAKS
jgi:hypothetical protein